MVQEEVSPTVFSETLKEELSRRGWWLLQLEGKLESLHFSDLHNLLRGIRGPTKQEFKEICGAMGVDEVRLSKTRPQIERDLLKAERKLSQLTRRSEAELDRLRRELGSALAGIRLRDKLIKNLKGVGT